MIKTQEKEGIDTSSDSFHSPKPLFGRQLRFKARIKIELFSLEPRPKKMQDVHYHAAAVVLNQAGDVRLPASSTLRYFNRYDLCFGERYYRVPFRLFCWQLWNVVLLCPNSACLLGELAYNK